MWNLKNKTVVISGATNGIGKAAAIELLKENPKAFQTRYCSGRMEAASPRTALL